VAQAAPQDVPFWQFPVVAAAFCACLAVWWVVATRLRQGRAVLPREPRREVPWEGIDLILVMAVYVALVSVALLLAYVCLGPEAGLPPAVQDLDKSTSAHLVEQLIEQGSGWIILICVFSAGVVAPIVEEFFFRLLLQGWLEKTQRRMRRMMPTLRRLVPGAVGPIVLTSLLFARMHFRDDSPLARLDYLVFMLAGDAVARLLTMAFAVWLLRLRVGATAEDLGWVPEKLADDVKLGLMAFAGLAAPVYAAQITLTLLLPKYLAPDPFVLFFFSLALGTLYYRTHRLVPAIVLHMALNVTSLILLWMMLVFPGG